MTAMIAIRGLSKAYGPVDVLRGVDLAVRRGRIIAIVGPNGAGKTTLIKSILGLTYFDAGDIAIDGVRIGADHTYRARIGYMPQIGRFPENLTARDLIAMLKDLRGGAADLDEELMDRFDLRRQLDRPLRVLSGGTKQKVNAVMAFLFSPDLLILDEPTAGLDPLSSSMLKDKILALRSSGTTFLLTSHIMGELEDLVDDIAFLLGGRMLFAGAFDELKRVTRQTTLERAVATLMSPARAACA
ncbi:MAG TPA: ABC transporter ATP-binding protein [Gemmatimonadaceae bacterium]|nr:ABC transporter ATP-binding protein [Gemmatimonadaceae bacterium]